MNGIKIDQVFQNPLNYEINYEMLQEFENCLDPLNPEGCQIPCRVLGYGEMSTVFEIQQKDMQGLAFKRMSIFEKKEELDDYIKTYKEYEHKLVDEIGLNLPSQGHAMVFSPSGRPIFYIIQEKLQPTSMGNKVIHLASAEMVEKLTHCALNELRKVWTYNNQGKGWQVGIDGQISNWVVEKFDANNPRIEEDACLYYIDTSTPMLRANGEEQLDTELFLRPAPRFLAWILRLLYLQDVMDRYYDFRKVAIDLLANFYKEQLPELIPGALLVVNDFFLNEAVDFGIEPIEEEEIRSYYKEDALIWRLYLSMRRLDRFLYQYVFRHEYPYILPGKINR